METFEKLGYDGLRSEPVPGTAQGICMFCSSHPYTPRMAGAVSTITMVRMVSILMPVLLIRN